MIIRENNFRLNDVSGKRRSAKYRFDKMGEGLNFEQSNFGITDISNLKINEWWNVERPNLRVTTTENENWTDKASKFIYIKRQIWEPGELRVVKNIE